MDTSSPQKDCPLCGRMGNVSLGLHSLNASGIPTPSLHCPFASLHLSPHATLTNLKCLQTVPDARCGQNCHQWRTTNLALCRKSCQPLNSKISRGRMCAQFTLYSRHYAWNIIEAHLINPLKVPEGL